jgi:hypothetical protein
MKTYPPRRAVACSLARYCDRRIGPGKPAEQLGWVSFANSCTPAVQASFQRAVALLHSYWWSEAEKTFRAVLERDPKCAIATWGIATTLIGNPFAAGPTPAQAQQAQEHLTTATTMYREMGMTYWLEQAEAELRQFA